MAAQHPGVERSGPAIRAVLAKLAPDELAEFEAEFRIALADADDTFDLAPVNQVLDRWWARAHLRLHPPTADERAAVERARRHDFSGLVHRTAEGGWTTALPNPG